MLNTLHADAEVVLIRIHGAVRHRDGLAKRPHCTLPESVHSEQTIRLVASSKGSVHNSADACEDSSVSTSNAVACIRIGMILCVFTAIFTIYTHISVSISVGGRCIKGAMVLWVYWVTSKPTTTSLPRGGLLRPLCIALRPLAARLASGRVACRACGWSFLSHRNDRPGLTWHGEASRSPSRSRVSCMGSCLYARPCLASDAAG
jgi:hypothetical protein